MIPLGRHASNYSAYIITLMKEEKKTNTTTTLDIDSIITRLLGVRSNKPGKLVTLKEEEIKALSHAAREIFMSQPCLVEISAPVRVCGTRHS